MQVNGYAPSMSTARTAATAATAAAASQPLLAPPGAGIPRMERLIGGTIFAFRRWRGTPAGWSALFQSERRAIDQLVQGSSPQHLAMQVLIPRLRGLEDSSRNWSVWMTLDHLRIVNTQIAGVMQALLADRVPPGKASTAAVKPGPEATAAVLPAYHVSCDAVERAAGRAAGGAARGAAGGAAAPSLRTRLRFAHPWFGPLDAAGWHAMAAMHMGIHKAQVRAILLGARSSGATR